MRIDSLEQGGCDPPFPLFCCCMCPGVFSPTVLGGPHLDQASGCTPRCAPGLGSPSLAFVFFKLLFRAEGREGGISCLSGVCIDLNRCYFDECEREGGQTAKQQYRSFQEFKSET